MGTADGSGEREIVGVSRCAQERRVRASEDGLRGGCRVKMRSGHGSEKLGRVAMYLLGEMLGDAGIMLTQQRWEKDDRSVCGLHGQDYCG